MLTTHVNPDGDGLGSMAALARRLAEHGVEPTIVTPTPPPATLEFVCEGLPVFSAHDPASADPLGAAEAVAVLDTAEPERLGVVAEHARRCGGVIVDHHPPVGEAFLEPAIRDPSACATGELIFDLLALDARAPSLHEAEGLYVAIATDTGSFQFSNTSPRTHDIAGELLRTGVDPEELYRVLYGQYTPGRLSLLQHALSRLEIDPLAPVAWVAVDHTALTRSGARSGDLEGLVEYPRRLQGIEVGLFFRGLSPNRTKVSLRSNGDADVSAIAQELGGGGHAKASGAVLDMALDDAVRAVVEAVRPAAQAAAGARAGEVAEEAADG